MKNTASFYNRLVSYIYGYFILLGLAWMAASLCFGGGFSYYAFILVLVFGIQAYFRKKLTNLILGILCLAVSIFWSLEFASLGHSMGFSVFVLVMLAICLISLALSIALIFSYTKLSFDVER